MLAHAGSGGAAHVQLNYSLQGVLSLLTWVPHSLKKKRDELRILSMASWRLYGFTFKRNRKTWKRETLPHTHFASFWKKKKVSCDVCLFHHKGHLPSLSERDFCLFISLLFFLLLFHPPLAVFLFFFFSLSLALFCSFFFSSLLLLIY